MRQTENMQSTKQTPNLRAFLYFFSALVHLATPFHANHLLPLDSFFFCLVSSSNEKTTQTGLHKQCATKGRKKNTEIISLKRYKCVWVHMKYSDANEIEKSSHHGDAHACIISANAERKGKKCASKSTMAGMVWSALFGFFSIFDWTGTNIA